MPDYIDKIDLKPLQGLKRAIGSDAFGKTVDKIDLKPLQGLKQEVRHQVLAPGAIKSTSNPYRD